MEVPKEIVFNWILDLRKKDIEPIERARILKLYLNSTFKSQRMLAKEIGIPHSTIQDWLLWGKISDKEYKEMKDSGLNDTEIYKELRGNKDKLSSEISETTKIDIEIRKAIRFFRPLISAQLELTIKTKEELKELINVLDRIIIHIELRK